MSDSRSDPVILRGRAFPPRQSREIAAELRLGGGRAEIVSEDGALVSSCLRSDIRFEAPVGSAPRRATLPDGTLFETEDRAGVAALSPRDAGSRIHALEKFHPRLAAFVVASVGALWLIWRYGLDLVAAAAVAITPPQVVDAIDSGTLKTFDTVIAAPSTMLEEDRRRAEAVFADLLAALDPETRAAHDFRLEFRSVPRIGPNAVALPGGTVVMTDDFLRLFPDDDVRAGVLAHEIGHIVERHGLRQLYRSVGLAVLVALIAGDTVAIVEDVVVEGNVLLSLSFSRASERAADAFGVKLSRAAGYDPAGLIEFFVWVQREIGDEASWLSTHTSSAERMETLRRLTGAE